MSCSTINAVTWNISFNTLLGNFTPEIQINQRKHRVRDYYNPKCPLPEALQHDAEYKLPGMWLANKLHNFWHFLPVSLNFAVGGGWIWPGDKLHHSRCRKHWLHAGATGALWCHLPGWDLEHVHCHPSEKREKSPNKHWSGTHSTGAAQNEISGWHDCRYDIYVSRLFFVCFCFVNILAVVVWINISGHGSGLKTSYTCLGWVSFCYISGFRECVH